MRPQYTDGATEHQSIYPNIPARISNFYHQILCYPNKRTLLQEIKDGSFSTCPGLTEKLISKYFPESEITAKGHLDQKKQRLAAASAANVTPLSTMQPQ